MPYRPGQIIGRHELVAPLGAGSMGEVWQAVLHGPQGFDKPVALKLLRESPSEILRGALIREARLGALLHHPNVVGIYELGSADGLWFVAMELVRGPSISDLLRAHHPLPPAAVLDIGIQAAAGLRHVHALKLGDRPAGLVHRDVKPSNLLVDRTGLVKVADLGMAAVSGSPSTGGGTPPYLAPEQARGQQDARADVWSLGVVLYELASGDRPFGSGAEAIHRARQVEDRLGVPAFLDPVEHAVKGLGEVVRRCLRLDPDDRWPSMAELGAALSEISVLTSGEGLVDLLARAHPELDVVDAGIRSTSRSSTSTPATVVVPEGNLPDPRDRFHGRSEEVDKLVALLGRERLVTVVGFGGLGKTRLALETGRATAQTFDGGVWCVDLSECRTELDVCATMSRTLGASPDRTDPCAPTADTLRALGRVLVVLDNLEQVRTPAAALLGRWLEAVPEAAFLCTSRTPLGVRGERLFPLGPLDAESAFQLFLDRAPGPLPAQHHPEVRALVQALDGLPLAIELAAARTRVMPVPQIARRLDDQLRLLAGGGEQYPERHRSLIASISWSWELLAPGHRVAMAQLSVMEGGFTLEAAEGVLDLTLFSGVHWAIDVLQELVDASLLRVDPIAGRFSMLQAVHAFASDRLGGEGLGGGGLGGADRVDAEVRHGRFFARMTEGAPLPVLMAEIDNLEVAARRAVARRDAAVAGATAAAALLVHERQGPFRRSAELMEQVLTLDLEPAVRVQVQRGAGRMRVLIGDGAAGRAHLEAALRTARESGLRLLQAQVLSSLGSAMATFGDHRATLVLSEEGLALAREAGSRVVEGQILQNVGNAQQALGRPDEAMAAYEAAIALLQRAGRPVVSAQSNLGALHMDLGEPELALGWLSRALDGCAEAGDRRQEAVIRGNLGQVFAALGMLVEARAQLEDARRLHQRVGNRRSEAFVLANLGGLWQREGRWHQAVEEHERALALAREIGLRKLEGGVLRELARDRLAMGDAATARVLLDDAERLLREVGAPYELARALCVRAELDSTARDQALAEARALAAELGVGPRSELALDLARAQG